MTEAEKQARQAQLVADELAGAEHWCWLSFVKDGVFQGCVMLRAHGMITAIQAAWRMGINPGGEVKCVDADAAWTPRVDGYADRLLTREDVAAFDAAYAAAGSN